jgi:cytochrome c556
MMTGKLHMKRIALTGAVLLSSLLSINAMAAAQLSPQEQAAATVATRQAVFKLLAFSNGALRPGANFNLDAAKLATQRIAMLGGMIPAVFETNTSKVTGLTTRANDILWNSKADFDKLANDLVAGANEALNTLNTKGADGARDASQAIGQKCGACHDKFRHD